MNYETFYKLWGNWEFGKLNITKEQFDSEVKKIGVEKFIKSYSLQRELAKKYAKK